jgi:hypothetical protein
VTDKANGVDVRVINFITNLANLPHGQRDRLNGHPFTLHLRAAEYPFQNLLATSPRREEKPTCVDVMKILTRFKFLI